MSDVTFPCAGLPADPAAARLIGLYPQRQAGLWLQRVKGPGGELAPRQWRAMAEAARRFSPRTPLHLTTRQDVELHDLTAEQVPEVQQSLAAAGLSGAGACGDTLRNITVCTCSGALDGAPDLRLLAEAMRTAVESLEGIRSLPRKFKISLSACPTACGQPWINDLGFVAALRGGKWGFLVAAGGSLGPRPLIAMLFRDWMAAEDAVPLAVAAVRVFAANGDRQNRSRARLRHVRERLGDEAFAALLRDELARTRAERAWPIPPVAPAATGLARRLALSFANGDVTPAAADALAALAEQADIRVRIANDHRVILFGRDDEQLRLAAAKHDALASAAIPQASVVACPGLRWCARGLADTNAMADTIRDELAQRLAPGTAVCISGCPNGCAHSGVADIGLVGAAGLRDGQRIQQYTLLTGGGMGRSDKLAKPIGGKLALSEVVPAIRRALNIA